MKSNIQKKIQKHCSLNSHWYISEGEIMLPLFFEESNKHFYSQNVCDAFYEKCVTSDTPVT